MGQGVYASAAFAKADIYSHHWGRLDSWWSVGKVGIFALVAFWARDDEIVSYSGKWSEPWRANQKLERGFALGRAGDRPRRRPRRGRAAPRHPRRRRSLGWDQRWQSGVFIARDGVYRALSSLSILFPHR